MFFKQNKLQNYSEITIDKKCISRHTLKFWRTLKSLSEKEKYGNSYNVKQFFTLGSLQDADLQAFEGFAGQFLQRAERGGLTEQRPDGHAVTRRGQLLSVRNVVCRSAKGITPSHGRLAENVLDAERRQRLVGVGRRRELIQRTAPPLLLHRWAFRVLLGGHGGAAGHT